jgi:hypothetical protein
LGWWRWLKVKALRSSPVPKKSPDPETNSRIEVAWLGKEEMTNWPMGIEFLSHTMNKMHRCVHNSVNIVNNTKPHI